MDKVLKKGDTILRIKDDYLEIIQGSNVVKLDEVIFNAMQDLVVVVQQEMDKEIDEEIEKFTKGFKN